MSEFRGMRLRSVRPSRRAAAVRRRGRAGGAVLRRPRGTMLRGRQRESQQDAGQAGPGHRRTHGHEDRLRIPAAHGRQGQAARQHGERCCADRATGQRAPRRCVPRRDIRRFRRQRGMLDRRRGLGGGHGSQAALDLPQPRGRSPTQGCRRSGEVRQVGRCIRPAGVVRRLPHEPGHDALAPWTLTYPRPVAGRGSHVLTAVSTPHERVCESARGQGAQRSTSGAPIVHRPSDEAK